LQKLLIDQDPILIHCYLFPIWLG